MSRRRCSILVFVTDVSRQLHPIVIHLRLATSIWRERSLTMTELTLSANGKRLSCYGCLKTVWLLSNKFSLLLPNLLCSLLSQFQPNFTSFSELKLEFLSTQSWENLVSSKLSFWFSVKQFRDRDIFANFLHAQLKSIHSPFLLS